MISVGKTFNGALIVAPMLVGAALSSIFYLAEGSAIPLTLFQLALLTGVFLFTLRFLNEKSFKVSAYGLETEYLVFLAIIFFSLLYSPERGQGLFFAVRFIVLLFTTYIIYNAVTDFRELKIVCGIFIGISIVIALANIYQVYVNPDIAAFNFVNEGKKIMRSAGTETDPNVYGSNFFVPILILVAYIGEAKTFKKRISLFVLVGIMLAAVLLSYSRSAWVSLFVGGCFIIWYQRKYSVLIYGLVAFVLVLFVSDTIQNIVTSVFTRLVDIFAGTEDDSSRFRIILAQTAIIMWLDSYTFGIGYQGFSTVFKQYHPPQTMAGVYEPHNEYYAVLAELGLIGFVVFMWILFKMIKRGWSMLNEFRDNHQSYALPLGIFAAFLSYLTFFQFLGGMQTHTIFMMTVALMFTAAKFSGISNVMSKQKITE